MAVRKKGLGKGLDSLISSSYTVKVDKNAETDEKKTTLSTKNVENVDKVVDKKNNNPGLENTCMLKISEVEPNRDQPRKNFDEGSLEELAESIRQFGILQPLIVRKEEDHYVIVTGERRWRAAKLAGIKEVPVMIKEYTNQEIMEISLIENIQRENLNAIEEAQAYQRLLTEFGYRQQDLADRLSRSRTAITNRLRLLKLSEKVQNMIQENMITEGHARALLPIEDEQLQFQTAMQVMDNNLSVRDTERLVKKILNPPPEKVEEDWRKSDQFIYDKLEENLRSYMGTKVAIKRKDKEKGKIIIDYYSSDELERLMELFRAK